MLDLKLFFCLRLFVPLSRKAEERKMRLVVVFVFHTHKRTDIQRCVLSLSFALWMWSVRKVRFGWPGSRVTKAVGPPGAIDLDSGGGGRLAQFWPARSSDNDPSLSPSIRMRFSPRLRSSEARARVCVCRVHKRRGDFPSRCAGLGAASRSVTSWPVGWLVLLPRRRKRFARVLVHRRGLASLLPTE